MLQPSLDLETMAKKVSDNSYNRVYLLNWSIVLTARQVWLANSCADALSSFGWWEGVYGDGIPRLIRFIKVTASFNAAASDAANKLPVDPKPNPHSKGSSQFPSPLRW